MTDTNQSHLALTEKYPFLLKGGREVIEKNIRNLLKDCFKGVRFSVRKESYSATRVSWIDGPTTSAVSEITSLFKTGELDSHGDHPTPFTELFGGVTQVLMSRESGDKSISSAIELVWEEFGALFPNLTEKPSVKDYHSGALMNHCLHNAHSNPLKSFQSLVFNNMRQTS